MSKATRRTRRTLQIGAAFVPFALAVGASAAPVTWDAGGPAGQKTFWDVTQNWNPDALPVTADDVTNSTGLSIEHRSGTDTINSFTTNGQLTLSGGTLTINTLLSFNSGGSLLMSGGTLANATIGN